MPARLDTHWSYRGLRALVLENERVRVAVLPELGAKVWEFVDKRAGRNWIWQHPRIEPRAVPPGVPYDDVWCGGWDDLFPSNSACRHAGEAYPDHGELWAVPWTWEALASGPREVRVRLTRLGSVTPTRHEKVLTLRAGEPFLRIAYEVANMGGAPIDCLWDLHVPLAISPGDRIDLPARDVVVDPDFRARFGKGVERFCWPRGAAAKGWRGDARIVPPPSARLADMWYGTNLAGGWCALTDPKRRQGFGLVFPRDVFNTVWVFATYGGWRGLYTAILEPCTGWPHALDAAAKQGTCARIPPGRTLRADVRAVVYGGVRTVRRIGPDGRVVGAR